MSDRIPIATHPEEEEMLIQLALTPGDFGLMSMLADWYEDAAYPRSWLAHGYKWCTVYKKYPLLSPEPPSAFARDWLFSHDDSDLQPSTYRYNQHARLPYALYRALERPRKGMLHKAVVRFRSHNHAMEALANGLNYLRREILLPGE